MKDLSRKEILQWLKENDPTELSKLFSEADKVRKENLGDEVHLRGLLEISNKCAFECSYCGIRKGNRGLSRYTMKMEDIDESIAAIKKYGYPTVVIQGGENADLSEKFIFNVIRKIKDELGAAVTLSLGERTQKTLETWREAGADRYLVRIETSNRKLFESIHPVGKSFDRRLKTLQNLRELGYQVGSGVMIGLPGQTIEMLADDLELFKHLDLDMVGIGPYIPHPATPLGKSFPSLASEPKQVLGDETNVLKMLALTRLILPEANIPSTTALATINTEGGRQNGLSCGANVIMPNVTPLKFRKLYEIYPGKASSTETSEQTNYAISYMLESINRIPGKGFGHRKRDLS